MTVCSCDREVSVSPPDAPPPTGFIAVESNPPGASIYLNGKITGKVTPDSLMWLKADMYKILLRLPLYRDTILYAKAAEGEKNKISVDYLSNPLMYGAIECVSDPANAAIFINEKFTGKFTPYTFKSLVPGYYLIKYQAKGCRDDSMVVIVKSNMTTVASETLQDTTIWLGLNSDNSPLPTDFLTCIEILNYDVKWIGTSDKGLVKYDGNKWEIFNPSNSPLPSIFITCLATDRDALSGRNLWIGTNNGLALYDGTNWLTYKTENSILPDNYISSISLDNLGNVWIGTLKGLVNIRAKDYRNPAGWILYNTSNSEIPADWINAVSVDISGKVWCGTSGSGLAFFNGKNWTTYTRANSGLPGNIVTALSTGLGSGGLWAGFASTFPSGTDPGGLAVYDNNKWITDIEGLPDKSIRKIVADYDARWICTSKGLLKYYNPDSYEIINSINSKLPSDNIADADFDSRNNMWIATADSGLIYFKKK